MRIKLYHHNNYFFYYSLVTIVMIILKTGVWIYMSKAEKMFFFVQISLCDIFFGFHFTVME